MASNSPPPTSLEAKLVVLGSQGVGKTSLVHRYVNNTFIPPNKVQSTVGASFLTTRQHDPESSTTIRLQIWDTAGQERFRSISRLYYRGSQAAILCYDVTSRKSFEEMGRWWRELRENCNIDGQGGDDGEAMILHIVGTKADLVAEDPSRREVPFEMCVEYVAEQMNLSSTSSANALGGEGRSADSNRSSGFWNQEHIFSCCHEISAKDNEGIDEVFRVVTRKIVEQHQRRLERRRFADEELSYRRTPGTTDGVMGTPGGYFDIPNGGNGSFRLGHGDKRRSWLGSLAAPGGAMNYPAEEFVGEGESKGERKGRCC